MSAQLAKLLKLTRFPRLVKQLWKNYYVTKDEQLKLQEDLIIDMSHLSDDQHDSTHHFSPRHVHDHGPLQDTFDGLQKSDDAAQPISKIHIQSKKRPKSSLETAAKGFQAKLSDPQNFLQVDPYFLETEFRKEIRANSRQKLGTRATTTLEQAKDSIQTQQTSFKLLMVGSEPQLVHQKSLEDAAKNVTSLKEQFKNVKNTELHRYLNQKSNEIKQEIQKSLDAPT